MKKIIALGIFISLSVIAKAPLEQMNSRLEDYKQIMEPSHCVDAATNNYTSSDYGLLAEVECEITCKGKSPQRQHVASSFIPSSYGLTPGNGSSDTNTVWRSLTVTMKVWSEEKCMEEASVICKGLSSIEDSNVIGMRSGDWKNNKNLGCEEIAVTLSPFDNSVDSKKLPAPFMEQFAESGGHSLPIYSSVFRASAAKPQSECKNKMQADLCFGDCIHDLGPGTGWKETLATPGPLGRSKESWCMDGFVSLIKNQSGLSQKVQTKLCEAFFWSNVLQTDGLASSCAAIRGTVECESLIKSLKN